jgi:hypothetical protein
MQFSKRPATLSSRYQKHFTTKTIVMKSISKILVFILIAWVSIRESKAQYGIGTRNPSPNAALDINSTNRGLMLPRLGDTTAVNGPSSGLMIFNSNTRTPTFHNGTTWRSMARLDNTNTVDANADSIVYTLLNNTSILAAGPFQMESLSMGGSTGEEKLTANITIPYHINSVNMQKIFMQKIPVAAEMEVRIYKRGVATPSYTYKFKNFSILANSFGHSNGNLTPSLSYTIWADKLSYKDVVNNISFGWSYISPIGLTTY